MKEKRLFVTAVITAAVVLALSGIGIVKKQTYTDAAGEEHPLYRMETGILSDSLAEHIASEDFADRMDEESNYVIKVKAVSDTEFDYARTSQRVVVEQVFRGEGLQAGEEIIVSGSQNLWELTPEKGVIEESALPEGCDWILQIGLGFVNEMQPGQEYLIFLQKRIWLADSKEMVYVFPGLIVRPIFSYEDRESIPMPSDGVAGDTIRYELVKDSEFFAQSEEGIRALRQLKANMMERYGQ